MAGTKLSYVIKRRVRFGPTTVGGDRLHLVVGSVFFVNDDSETRELDLSADIPDLQFIKFNPTGGYVFSYVISTKAIVIHGATALGGAGLPLPAVTAKDLGDIEVPFMAVGF